MIILNADEVKILEDSSEMLNLIVDDLKEMVTMIEEMKEKIKDEAQAQGKQRPEIIKQFLQLLDLAALEIKNTSGNIEEEAGKW